MDKLQFDKPMPPTKHSHYTPGGRKDHTGCDVNRSYQSTTSLLDQIRDNHEPNKTAGTLIIGGILAAFILYTIFY